MGATKTEPDKNTYLVLRDQTGADPDYEHAAFDNCAFWDEDRIVFVEDRGDTLHTQGNAFDSGWMFDARVDYASPARKPVRILAQGRDPSATIDSGLQGTPGFQNDGDNELTGIHVSDGDPSPHGLLGAKRPRPFEDGGRVFYSGQHGDNLVFEIVPVAGGRDEDDDHPPPRPPRPLASRRDDQSREGGSVARSGFPSPAGG